MKKALHLLLLLYFLSPALGQENKPYFPPPGSWQRQSPEQAGLDNAMIRKAIDFAVANETKAPHDAKLAQAQGFGKEPFSEPIGPLKDRGAPAGVIVYKGRIIAEWGEPSRVDMSHSITKSFLSTVVGLAVDSGLINSTGDTVSHAVKQVTLYDPATKSATGQISPFASAHNSRLTWDVLLRQASDWEGTLWGKPDWADRPDRDTSEWKTRKRNEPGTVWKYNDVRVNALALAATVVWKRPLPQVLKEYIMDPIGASDRWEWNGYDNAWIAIGDKPVLSVGGGGHWGGGMFIDAYDMARFGLLTLNYGNWNGRQLISGKWVMQALTPTAANTGYGYMNWFLNTDKKLLPSAPVTTWAHLGNGTNMIYCDPEHDLVIVARWIENKAIDGLVKSVLDAFGAKKN